MEKKLQSEFEVPAMEILTTPQTVMNKLYTEEQLRDAIAFGNISRPNITNDDWIKRQTPIELPTDIEISKQATYHGVDEHSFFTEATQNQKTLSFLSGAKWMRDKIKGGENE